MRSKLLTIGILTLAAGVVACGEGDPLTGPEATAAAVGDAATTAATEETLDGRRDDRHPRPDGE